MYVFIVEEGSFEFVINWRAIFMVIPEGVRSRGWENLRMGMPSMVETPILCIFD